MILCQFIFPGIGAFCFGQIQDDSLRETSERIYAIQIAASKVFIDPEFFKQKLNITENVRYFLKDGWYKYIIGTYKTEAEATGKLAGFQPEAFVTSVIENRSLPETRISSTNTSQLSQIDSLISRQNESEMRQLYNRKIREGDSAFNIARNLLLARKLYLEASLIDQDKNYPKDQIVEIDKQLIQNQSQSIFSKLTLKEYVIGGFAVLLILVLCMLLLFRARMQKLIRQIRGVREENLGPGADFDFEETAVEEVDLSSPGNEAKDQVIIDEILQLYPNLSEKISSKLGKTRLDHRYVHNEMERCLNSSNEILRMEAELAWIRLDIDDPFSFLDKLGQDFTPWEQLHVFEMIKRNKVTLPDFSRWLNSPNETVVLFCRRMTGDKGIDDKLWKSDEDLQAVALHILKNKIKR